MGDRNMTGKREDARTRFLLVAESKYEERGLPNGKTSSFKPVKPANVSRPQNVKVPPPPKYSRD